MQMNLSHEDAVMLWNDVVGMACDYGDASILPWLERLTPVSLENAVMTVSTGQNWTIRKVMGEYRPLIEKLLSDITMEPIALQVVRADAAPVAAQPPAHPEGAVPGAGHATAIESQSTAPEMPWSQQHSARVPAANALGETYMQAEPVEATNDAQQRLSPAALAGAEMAAGRAAAFSPARAAAQSVYPQQAAPYGAYGAEPLPAGYDPQPDPFDPHRYAQGSAGEPVWAQSTPAPEPEQDFTLLTKPETVAQDAVVPILEDGTIPRSAVSSGYSDFSFDTYIVGESNNLAFNMARTVAEQPGGTNNLNPLFIWGPSGNGKTHLLLSIANYLHGHQPNMNVQYVPSNAFVDQYIDDIRNKRLKGKEVLKSYRSVDVLLVDDVQFFESKQESVSTFFDIFNQLILAGKQIVLAADTPPDYLRLDDRMRTRFGNGLVVDIMAPTIEMKRSILLSYYERCRERMDWCQVEIPSKLFDIITDLAPNNPRSMQGLMTSIIIKASNDPSVLSPDGIKEAISELFKSTESVSIASIIRKVCEVYDVTAEDVKGKSRTKNISEARQVVMWMARQLTDESYENIGAELGGRDHSTVYYGISTIEKRSLSDRSYLFKLDRLKKEIVG